MGAHKILIMLRYKWNPVSAIAAISDKRYVVGTFFYTKNLKFVFSYVGAGCIFSTDQFLITGTYSARRISTNEINDIPNFRKKL